jgi:alkylated DNA repair dioxygenase AlkB
MTVLPQPDLFQAPPSALEGLSYQRDVIEPDEEQELVREIGRLPFKPFEFHGYLGKRRVVSFGRRYDYNEGALREAGEIPAFLLPLRERAARFAKLAPDAIRHALVTEYEPGAGIGWHRDRPQFDEVIGISLLSPCVLRFRRRRSQGWERRSLRAEPRSAYLLTGASRREWQHSIASVDALRYSVTFRRLVD